MCCRVIDSCRGIGRYGTAAPSSTRQSAIFRFVGGRGSCRIARMKKGNRSRPAEVIYRVQSGMADARGLRCRTEIIAVRACWGLSPEIRQVGWVSRAGRRPLQIGFGQPLRRPRIYGSHRLGMPRRDPHTHRQRRPYLPAANTETRSDKSNWPSRLTSPNSELSIDWISVSKSLWSTA